MNFQCPICNRLDDFCVMEPCKGCNNKLRQGVIRLEDFEQTVEAEAELNIGIYTIEGNSRSVVIKRARSSLGWRTDVVATVMIGIAFFVGIDDKLIERFVKSGDWSRLEKAKIFL